MAEARLNEGGGARRAMSTPLGMVMMRAGSMPWHAAPLCAFYAEAAYPTSILCSVGGYAPRTGLIMSGKGTTMIDILLLALGVGVFGLMAAYIVGCERV